jgi:hypothetical protein
MMHGRVTYRSKPKPCSDDSKRVSGVMNFPHTPLRSMAGSNPAGYERQTRVIAFSPESHPQGMRVALLGR